MRTKSGKKGRSEDKEREEGRTCGQRAARRAEVSRKSVTRSGSEDRRAEVKTKRVEEGRK